MRVQLLQLILGSVLNMNLSENITLFGSNFKQFKKNSFQVIAVMTHEALCRVKSIAATK